MRQRERGTAILITMILIVALLAGGAVLVGMQLRSTRTTDLANKRMQALYCAEAGAAAARQPVASNFSLWNASLCNPPAPRGTGACVIGSAAAEPVWLRTAAGVDHDLDNDGVDDFVLTLVDNDDESPAANNYTNNNDLKVYVISTCVMFPEIRQEVIELIEFTPGDGCINTQYLGCF